MKLWKILLPVLVLVLVAMPNARAAGAEEDFTLVQLHDSVGVDEFIAAINNGLAKEYKRRKMNHILRITGAELTRSDDDFDFYLCATNDGTLGLQISVNKAGCISIVDVIGVCVWRDGMTSVSAVAGCEATTSVILEYLGATKAQVDKAKKEAEANRKSDPQYGMAGFWCAKANRAFMIQHEIQDFSKDETIYKYTIVAANKWK